MGLAATQGNENQRVFDGSGHGATVAPDTWPVTGVPGPVPYSGTPSQRANQSRRREPAGPRPDGRGFHEEARHCQARKRRQLQLGSNVRPGFPPHSRWRHLQDAVLYEVRSKRRCLLCVGLAGQPRPRSRREHGVRRSGPLSLLSACHRKIESLLVAGAYRYVVLGWGFSPYKGSKSTSRCPNTCSSTASLRATATTALRLALWPPRAANRKPQRRSVESSPQGSPPAYCGAGRSPLGEV